MSTTPVTPAKESVGQKIESVFTGIGKVIQDVENGIINLSVAEEPTIAQYLPPTIASAYNSAVSIAAQTWAAMEATEQQIGAEKVPYAQKAAIIVALQGANIAKALVAGGALATAANVQQVVSLAAGAAAINWSTITEAPVPPTTTTESTTPAA